MNNNEINLSNNSNTNNLLFHKYGKNSSGLSGHNSTRSNNKNNFYDNDNIETNIPIMEQRPNI